MEYTGTSTRASCHACYIMFISRRTTRVLYIHNSDVYVHGYRLYSKPHLLHCPGSLTLGEVRAASWGARAEWFNLGFMLSLPFGTLEVIEGHAVSQHSIWLYVLNYDLRIL